MSRSDINLWLICLHGLSKRQLKIEIYPFLLNEQSQARTHKAELFAANYFFNETLVPVMQALLELLTKLNQRSIVFSKGKTAL